MPPTPASPVAHQALYRRWRAQTFSQMVGQHAVVETLRNAVRTERLSHGFLFVGPRGTGKTSMARILAKAINCTDLRDGEPCDRCPSCVAIREGRALDVVELDAASNNRVDDMRELLPRVYTSASDLRRKVFIIDEVQRIKEGWDVLLKTLEEPPDGVVFIFCTTDPSQIRPAVVSRLQRFTFRPLAVPEIEGKLTRILEAEARHAEPEAVGLVARLAAGGMRDAESLLDQVLGSSQDPITADAVRDLVGLAQETAVERFIDALAGGDALAGMAVLDDLEAEGRDLVGFSEQAVVALRHRLVERLTAKASDGGGAAGAADLARAARRLSGLDASRGGLGGYRWQLELALLASAASGASAGLPYRSPSASPAEAAVVPTPVVPTPVVPTPVVLPVNQTSVRLIAPAPRSGAARLPLGTAAALPRPTPSAPPAEGPRPSPSRAVPPGPAGIGGDELFRHVRARWPEIVAQIGRNPANRPIVSACKPIEVRDGMLILGFPEDQPFLREKAEQRRSALEDGLAIVLGRPVGVRCVVANVELAEPDVTADEDLVAQALRVFGGDLTDVTDIS